jgi:hypothetical protein
MRTTSTDEEEKLLPEEIHQCEAEIDVACCKLGGANHAVIRVLHELMQGVTRVPASLEEIGTPWAQVQGQNLLEAVQRAEINRGDREGKILLSLPDAQDDEAAYREWLRSVRRVDENPDMLAAAGLYVVARLRKLRAAIVDVGTSLSAIHHPEAQACATRLRRLATEPPTAWPTV